jgi:hypothetical protein
MSISTVFVVLFSLSGCAGAYSKSYEMKTPQPLAHVVKVYEHDDTLHEPIYFENKTKVSRKDLKQMNKQLAETFYAAAIYGKEKGYKYFAIVEEKTNNLEGFPVNDFLNMKKICNWEVANAKKHYKPELLCWDKHSKSLIGSYIGFEVRFFKEPIPGVFLYNIDETIAQTKTML